MELKVLLFIFLLVSSALSEVIVFNTTQHNVLIRRESDDDYTLDWWQRATFYQVYPRSFKDSDNDGNGDLNGIIEKLPYLQELGVQAVWLSPIYTSPQVDGGYDISDYRAIDPIYGTSEDFLKLVEEAHKLGLKIILDLVPNHTSDLHEWFQKSVNREEGYEDYYLWIDAKIDEDGNKVPPNNWLSVWNGPVWTWNEVRQQYYLHQFSDKQPDLNYRSERVQQEIKDVMTYWLDLGVDGFRIDAVPHLVEDEQLRDEPINPDSDEPDDYYNHLQHIYTKDQNLTFDIVYSWRDHLDNYTKTHGGATRVFMTESASDIDEVVRYYGADGRLGAHFSFNFWFLGMREYSRASDVVEALFTWATKMTGTFTRNWLTGNHDNRRVASRVDPRNIDGYNMLITFLKGVTITYMAEEIGQEDGEVTCEQGQDPSAIKDCDTFAQVSRDFERTPFQWDNTTNAGFNDGNDTWLPVSEKYLKTNLEDQKNSNRSHYTIYKKLMAEKPNWKKDSQTVIKEPAEGVLHIRRAINFEGGGFENLNLLFNLNNETITNIDISMPDEQNHQVFISSVNSIYHDGEVVEIKNITLGPGDALITIALLP